MNKNRKPKRIKKILILISIFTFLTACTFDNGMNTPEEIARYLNAERNDLKHFVEFENAKLVFYIPPNKIPSQGKFDVGLGWIKKDKRKWKWVSGGAEQNVVEEDITYSWTNLDQMTNYGDGAHIFWGIINNNDISKVHVKYRNNWELNQYAEIIEVGDKRIWYVLADYYYGTIPGVDITGFSASGEKLYEHY